MGLRQGNIGRDGPGAIAHLVAAKTVEQPLARAFRKRAALIFAGEVALAERRISEQAHLLAIEDLGEPGLEGAIDEVVGVLDRDDARKRMDLGSLEKAHHAPWRLVGEANES